MSTPLKTLVAIDSGADRQSVEAVIPASELLELVGVVEGLEGSWDELSSQSVDVLLVACAGEGDDALSFVDGVSRHYPERPVVVLHRNGPQAFVSRAFAAGAEDVVVLPASNGQPASPAARERAAAEVASVVEKAMARRRRASAAPRTSKGRMVTILGPKGGSGKTLVSCNLAMTMADAGKRVVVVDLDLQFGDIALALGIAPEKTVYDLVASGGSLDVEKLGAYLVEHSSGARVLAAPARPDQAATVTPEFLRELFDVLRGSVDWVIVDTPPGFTPEVIAAIDVSTDICMVGMLDSLSLKNTKLGLETLDLMGVERQDVKLVLNRAHSRVGISEQDVRAITGRAPDVLVPSNRDIPRSVNEAVPIVSSQPRSDAGRALRALGESYVGTETGNGASSRRSLLRRR